MSVLVYSRTAGYRHESIPTAIQVIRNLSQSSGYDAVFSEDPTAFNTTYLAGFAALCFLSNSDEILDSVEQRLALWTYLANGGNLIGIHSANAALFDEPFFGQALGSFFSYHPTLQQITFNVQNDSFPMTDTLSTNWTFEEEAYNFRSDPRATNITPLITVDSSSYTDPEGTQNYGYWQGVNPRPVSWLREGGVDLGNNTGTNGMNATLGDTLREGRYNASGRVFYTSLGHLSSTWLDSHFQNHINNGILWSLGINGSQPSTGVAATSASQIPSLNPSIGLLVLVAVICRLFKSF